MMNLRKWSDLDEAEKLGRKNAFCDTFIVAGSMCLLFVGLFIGGIVMFDFPLLNATMLLFPIPIIFCLSILLYFTHRNDCIKRAYDTISNASSETFVKEHLPHDEYCRVRIFKTRAYEDFIIGLADEGEAYAVLSTNNQLITLYIKIKGTDTYRKLDVIKSREFSSYCELL